MAKFKLKLKQSYEKVPDWLWPHLTGEPSPAPNQQLALQTSDEALLAEIERVIDRRIEQVDERHRNVETKLVALLALTSVLLAAVTASFALASTMYSLKDFPSWS